jgi:hypothetical protein
MLAAVVLAAVFDLNGYVAARGVNATGPESWLAGDVGRLEAGGDRDDFFAAAQFGVDWSGDSFSLHVSGAARKDPEEFGGDDAGLVEAYVEARHAFSRNELQLRAGQFFLPTSRENKDELWTSPYTINFSALNTWIAQEVRPAGLDLQWRRELVNGHSLTLGATGFRGNDTMGALLGWRGWTAGNRLSTYGELLPLPPLPELRSFFARQRDDGTKPFGSDLDGNTGYSARIRYSLPERANVQYAFVDNQGDRRLYRTVEDDGEYAWATSFHLVGAEIGNTDSVVLAAEFMTGKTGMGDRVGFVDADFYATYALVSWKLARNRLTARLDLFGTEEQDFSLADRNDESGRSWTLAWLYDVNGDLRAGLELTQMTGHRGAVSMDGRGVTLEARYRF